MEERIYNINISKLYIIGRHRERAKKAIKLVKAFAARHMKTADEKVVMGMDVNEYLWRNGMQRPPRKIRVKMMKDKDGTVMVTLEKDSAGKKPDKITKTNEEKKEMPKEQKKEIVNEKGADKKPKAAKAKETTNEQKKEAVNEGAKRVEMPKETKKPSTEKRNRTEKEPVQGKQAKTDA